MNHLLPPDQPNPWSRVARRTAYQNPWIIVYHDDVLRPDGGPGIYGLVHYRNRAVGVVALDDADRVLLVGQYRYTLDCYSWELPEGGGEFEEPPITSAQRELREETGYTARTWRELGRAHLSNSVSDEEAVYYLARDLEPGNASPEPTEELQTRWVPFRAALELARSGVITDALSILALERLALVRLQEGW